MASREWLGVKSLCILLYIQQICCTTCYATDTQHIKVMEFWLEPWGYTIYSMGSIYFDCQQTGRRRTTSHLFTGV